MYNLEGKLRVAILGSKNLEKNVKKPPIFLVICTF